MAFSKTATITQTVFGNVRVWTGYITADAATGVVSGFGGRILHAQVGVKSAATANLKFQVNANASGVAGDGDLGFSGVASGDVFCATVYFR